LKCKQSPIRSRTPSIEASALQLEPMKSLIELASSSIDFE
jgi:hypothetical protein